MNREERRYLGHLANIDTGSCHRCRPTTSPVELRFHALTRNGIDYLLLGRIHNGNLLGDLASYSLDVRPIAQAQSHP